MLAGLNDRIKIIAVIHLSSFILLKCCSGCDLLTGQLARLLICRRVRFTHCYTRTSKQSLQEGNRPYTSLADGGTSPERPVRPCKSLTMCFISPKLVFFFCPFSLPISLLSTQPTVVWLCWAYHPVKIVFFLSTVFAHCRNCCCRQYNNIRSLVTLLLCKIGYFNW